MLNKRKTIFLATLLGTIVFWCIAFISYEIWINNQPESACTGSIQIDPKSDQKKAWIEFEQIVKNSNVIPNEINGIFQDDNFGGQPEITCRGQIENSPETGLRSVHIMVEQGEETNNVFDDDAIIKTGSSKVDK